MKHFPTADHHTVIIDDDMEPTLARYTWRLSRPRRGGGSYAVSDVQENGRRRAVRMHRLVIGAKPGEVVDHINGDTLDNRRENLRRCDWLGNGQNKTKRAPTLTGYKGVSYHQRLRTRPFAATITASGVVYNLGIYPTAIEAAVAYDTAAKRLHGQFANLNFSAGRDWIFPFRVAPEVRGSGE